MILYIYIYIIHRHTTHTHIYIYYCFGIPHRIIAVEGISPLLPLTWAGKCHRSPIKLTVLAPIARMATFVRKMGLTRLWRFVRFAPPQENTISFCRWITSFFHRMEEKESTGICHHAVDRLSGISHSCHDPMRNLARNRWNNATSSSSSPSRVDKPSNDIVQVHAKDWRSPGFLFGLHIPLL